MMRLFQDFSGRLLRAGLFVLIVVAAAPAARAVEIQTVTGASGVEAWLVEDYSAPIVTVALAFDGGSAQDPQGKEGLADLLSTLFDEGAGDYDSKQFQSRLDRLGVTLQFSDTRDRFFGVMRTLRDDRAAAFEMLRLSLNELHFDEDSIRRMREALKSRIAGDANDPTSKASDALRASLFGDHLYSRAPGGTQESLDAIAREDILAQFAKLFARDNLHVAIVGAIDATETKAMLDAVFGALPAHADLRPVPEAQLHFGARIDIQSSSPQASVTITLPGVRRAEPDFFAAFLVNQILGGGTFSSRLYDEVREKRGLAYSVGSSIATFDRAAYLIADAGTRSDRVGETLSIMREQIERMAREGPTQAELDAAKKYVIGSYAINFLDTSSKIARALVTIQTENLGIDYIDRRAALIDAVTLDEARAAARRMLGVEPTVVVVGPGNS